MFRPERGSQVALQGPIPVDFGAVFPDGVYAAGGFEPVRDFDRSEGDRFVQQIDKASGLPLWTVEVIDADPAARSRTVKVKIAADHPPVLPPAAAGMPFVPVEFTSLTVTSYVNQAGRLAYSLKAAGGTRPGPARRPPGGRWEGGSGVKGQGGSFGHLGVHVGTDWTVQCNTYTEHAPILDIELGSHR